MSTISVFPIMLTVGPAGTTVTLTISRKAGFVSLTTTFVAFWIPLLNTRIVNTTISPTSACSGLPALVTAGSTITTETVPVAVGVGDESSVPVGVGVSVGVGEASTVSVAVGVLLGVGGSVGVSVAVGVLLGVSVSVGVSVAVGVLLGVSVSVGVSVAVGVLLGVSVSVGVSFSVLLFLF